MGYTLTGPNTMFDLTEYDVEYILDVYAEMHGHGAGKSPKEKLRSGDIKMIERVRNQYASRN